MSAPGEGRPDQGAAGVPGILARLESVEALAVDLATELADCPAGGPWLWRELTGEQRTGLWAELDDFVTWLQNRILSGTSNPDAWIEPCWYRHPDAVEMLTALMVAHAAAYRPKAHKPSFTLVDWFHRALWPTMDQLKARGTFKNCREKGTHHTPGSTRRLEAASEDFTAFLDAEPGGAADA